MLEIITAESSQRPDGSPPTYDDAMKFVNDAFDNSEDSEVGFMNIYIEFINCNLFTLRARSPLQHIHQIWRKGSNHVPLIMSTPDLLKAEAKLSSPLFEITSVAQIQDHLTIRITQREGITNQMAQLVYHHHPRLIQATMISQSRNKLVTKFLYNDLIWNKRNELFPLWL